jgi:hypothetical protein
MSTVPDGVEKGQIARNFLRWEDHDFSKVNIFVLG